MAVSILRAVHHWIASRTTKPRSASTRRSRGRRLLRECLERRNLLAVQPLVVENDAFLAAEAADVSTVSLDEDLWVAPTDSARITSDGLLLADTTPPTVTLTSPNSGTFEVGQQIVISASASDASGISHNAYYLEKGATRIGDIYLGNMGDGVRSYTWTVPATLNGYTLNGTDYRIKVAVWDASANHNSAGDYSNSYFTLKPQDTTPPTVTLTSPNSGTFEVGQQIVISASASDASGISHNAYYLEKGATRIGDIYLGNMGDGVRSYTWTVPVTLNGYAINGTDYRIKVAVWDASSRNNSAGDYSDSYLTLKHESEATPPTVTLTSPNSGTFEVGQQIVISASASDASGISHNAYYLEKGATRIGDIYLGNMGDGVRSYTWTVPATLNGYSIDGNDYRIKVAVWDASPRNNSAGDYSDNYLTLKPLDTTPPTVTLTSPNSGTFEVGQQVVISASASDASGISHNAYYLEKGATRIGDIYLGNMGDGVRSYTWTVQATLNGHTIDGTDYRIKVAVWDVSSRNNSAGDYSDSYLTLKPVSETTPPTVTLTRPNSGTFTVGQQIVISATASDASGISHNAYYLEKGATRIGDIYLGNMGDGVRSYTWTVPATLNGHTIDGTDYRIKVAVWDASPKNNSAGDYSDGYLTLKPASTGLAFPETAIKTSNSSSPYASTLNAFGDDLRGQCTWYAYGRVIELADQGYLAGSARTIMEAAFLGATGRHAKYWPSFLDGTWTATNVDPLPVAQRVPGQLVVWGGGTYGHVGFVEEVSADKSRYRVSEFNFASSLAYTGDAWFNFVGGSDYRLGTYPQFYQLPLVGSPTLPAAPTLTSPGVITAPGPVLSTTQPSLQWQGVTDADQYDLHIRQMNADGSPGNLVFDSDVRGVTISGSTISYALPSGILENGGYYRWSMRSHSSAGWGTAYAPALYFSVNTDLPAYNQPFLKDTDLTNASSMTVDQIRSFLAQRGSYFAQSRADVDGVAFDAAQVIYDAAQQFQINPQVLLATLQKESGGVTAASRPSDTTLRSLMGAGSPTTARQQLNFAAQLFRSYQNSLISTGQTVSGWRVGVAKATLDGVTVTPATNAVAGQFTYTPHAGTRWGGTSPGGVSLFAELWQQYGFGGATSDTEPPVVTSASADKTSVNRGETIRFSWTATDNVAVRRISLYLYQNGTFVDTSAFGVTGGNVDGRIGPGAESILNNGTGFYDWTAFNTLPPGSYRIKVAAWDTSDNSSSGTLPDGQTRYKWIDFSVTGANAGFTISPPSGLVTAEPNGVASFTIKLNTQPKANVMIALSSNDATEGTVSSSSLTFTPANWNTPQTVTVTGVDDAVADGNIAYKVITAAASSSDANYNGLNPDDVSVTNNDNDPQQAPGFSMALTSAAVTTEAGGKATFTMVLSTQPTADVTVGLSSTDTTEGTVSPASLKFTSANWNTPQTATVTGADDTLVDGNVTYSVVTAAATSADPSYNGINPPDVSLVNNDNETGSSAIVVTNTNDSGAGSLRQGVLDANSRPGRDEIRFAIPGSGTRTILLLSSLPVITDSVAIDATTQSGYVDKPIVEINGAGAGDTDGLILTTSNSAIVGLAINRFVGFGIRIDGSSAANNVIAGNFIGTDAAGTSVLANGRSGIWILNGAHDNRIGTNGDGVNDALERNLVAGNGFDGIAIEGAGTDRNIVAGNLIGTDITGTVVLGINFHGVLIKAGAKQNRVGTDGDGQFDAAERNVISGNRGDGVIIVDRGTDNNVVAGNFIGTDIRGTAALGGNHYGVKIEGGPKGNRIGTNGDGLADIAERNIVSGNLWDGVFLGGIGTENNIVSGNFIGPDVNGEAPLGNNYGVRLDSGAAHNRIGTNADGTADSAERNVISGNRFDGVLIFTRSTRDNTVAGNFIGTNAAGTSSLTNGFSGIWIVNADENTIGGTAPGAGNVISGNSSSGVSIHSVGVPVYQWTTTNGGNGHYYVVAPWDTWPNLEAAAVQLGGHLVTIETAAEQTFLATDPIPSDTLWIGATDEAVEGTFRWASGAPLSYTNWMAGEPNNAYGTEDYAEMNAGVRGQWNDNSPTGVRRGLIELTTAPDAVALRTFFGSRGNLIQGNLIGTNASGNAALANSAYGVEIQESPNNTIGGAANMIAFNGQDGAAVVGLSATGNSIRGNAIYANGGLGIDLGNDGVTANDSGDGDSGPNGLQNFPVLLGVTSGAQTQVSGTLNAKASTSYVIDFYASAALDPSGHGEGQTHVGSVTVTTGATGNASFSSVNTSPIPSGQYLTATATDPSGNTSEFSAPAPLSNQAPTIASLSDSPDPVAVGSTLTLTANGVTDADGTIAKVEFYRDVNGNTTIDVGIDTLLASDTSSTGGWTWTGAATGFALGANIYMARAQDDDLAWSTTTSTTGTVAASAGVTVNPTSGLVTTEAGGTAAFSVKLNSQPTANVTIALSSSDTTEGTISPASLVFTTANWSAAQTVTVSGANDTVVDGNVSYTIVTAAATSTDAAYNGYNPADVAVTNNDDDSAAGKKIDVNLIVAATSSPADTAASLPQALASVRQGQTFYVEMWAKNADQSTRGIIGGFVDFAFDKTKLTAAALNHGSLYSNAADGRIDNANGLIDDFGGTVAPGVGDKGDDEWVRLGYVSFTATAQGTASFVAAPGIDQFARSGDGGVPWSSVALNTPPVSIEVLGNCPYDIDGNGSIGTGDYSFFSAAWHMRPGDAAWDSRADFDHDSFVGTSDYSWFSANWRKSADDPTITYPPAASGLLAAKSALAMAASPVSIDVELVPVSSPSALDTAAVLPSLINRINAVGDTFFVEAWAKNADTSTHGIIGGYLDVTFDRTKFSGGTINHGAVYTDLDDGTVNNATGLVNDWGGNAAPGVGDKGDNEWVRLGYVPFTATATGTASFTASPGIDQFARSGEGGIAWANVELNNPTVSVTIGAAPSDIRMQSIALDGGTGLIVTYAIGGGPASPFEVGFYRSANALVDAADELLDSVLLDAPSDLTVGVHAKTFSIGSGAGQVALPGAGVAEQDVDYYLLTFADRTNAVNETGSAGGETNNIAVVTGVYHAAGGPVMFHGTGAADVVKVLPQIDPPGIQLDVKGVIFNYTLNEVTGIRARAHNGNDEFQFRGDSGFGSPGTLVFLFDGGSGTNTAKVWGSTSTTDKDIAQIYPMKSSVRGPGYSLSLAGTRGMTVTGQGGPDEVYIYDSSLSDIFTACPMYVTLSNSLYTNRAEGFRNVFAYAQVGGAYQSAGGEDVAHFYGIDGTRDYFRASATYAIMADSETGRGTTYFVRGNWFEEVHAYGGTVDGRPSPVDRDQATLDDAATIDLFEADAAAALATYRYSGLSTVNAHTFRVVKAYGSSNDTANLYGPGYKSAPNPNMYTTDYTVWANGFAPPNWYPNGRPASVSAAAVDAALPSLFGDDLSTPATRKKSSPTDFDLALAAF